LKRAGVIAAILLAQWARGAGVVARFDPSSTEVGPFPTDFLTTADPAQATGLRVSLPLPDCRVQPSSCRETSLLNQLDGFHIQPRLRVRFSAAIRPETLRQGVFLVRVDGTGGAAVRINQVVFDPTTNTGYAESDQGLATGARYALIVTTAVRNTAGDAVGPDPAFLSCLASGEGYCGRLRDAVARFAASGPPRARAAPARIVAASVFTTLSATAWLEKARAAIQSTPINFERLPSRAAIDVDDILFLTLRLQERVSPVEYSDTTVPLPQVLLTGVRRVAFGSFQSPSFLDAGQTIPQRPTGTAVASPAASSTVLFHTFLPSSPRPATGYPVILFGHGLNDSRFGASTLVASTFARAGFATVAMNAVGHGSGPRSHLRLTLTNGSAVEIPAGGRSLDLNGDGRIESAEGCIISTPDPIGLRDCLRQTALDLTQLVRAIRGGLDLDGDGVVDLDGNRIYYAGQSLGAIYGTLVVGIEPGIRAGVLNAGGATAMDIARWSPDFRGFPRGFLESRTPSLLNRSGDYDENYVLRNRPVKINDVSGAIEIQNLFDNLEWLHIQGDPLAYATQLKAPVLWQFARGDRTVPNPQSSALIRTAGNLENVQLYRHDLARAASPDLPANPHAYLVDIRTPAGIPIALAVQSQITGFFASNGTSVPAANSVQLRILFGGRTLFETPESLPEDLGF